MALAEFVANNAINVVTGHTPFFLQFGDHPIVPSILMHGGGGSSQVEAVQVMGDRMKMALEEAQTNLTVTQNRAKAYADKSQRLEIFQEGDKVVLSACNLSVNQHLPTKLRRHWIGPYSITKVISPMAYRLDLPNLACPSCLSCVQLKTLDPI